jgi:hypothetical protein
MASSFIPVNASGTTSARLGSYLMNAINQLLAGKDQLTIIQGMMNAMRDVGQGDDFTAIETYYGLPTGSGPTVLSLITGSLTDINASMNTTNLLGWLGATR